jgi:putative DNA-invertase from lambdoid prophage Rac
MVRSKTGLARVWLYARFSTDGQSEGTSLAVQRSQLKAICETEGLKPTGFVIDKATSGGKPLAQRENGGRMLARLRKGDVVVGLKLDRVFRNAADCLTTAADLHKRGVRLYLHDLGGWISGTPEAEFRLTIFAGVAQFERRRIATRIREAKAYLRTIQRFEGGDVPFGYRKIESPTGEHTRQGKPTWYVEPDEEVHGLAGDLMTKGYSTRLARGVFVERGYQVSHVAVAKLFRKLRRTAACPA